jgi:hypothetical protein
MLFHDPDTLQFWINVFFTVTAASVALACTALAVGIRDLRRPVPAAAAPVPARQLSDVNSAPARRAA